jgi:hypothetical protein
MASHDFDTNIFFVTITGFAILIKLYNNNTKVLQFSISYFAVSGETNFASNYLSILSVSTI